MEREVIVVEVGAIEKRKPRRWPWWLARSALATGAITLVYASRFFGLDHLGFALGAAFGIVFAWIVEWLNAFETAWRRRNA